MKWFFSFSMTAHFSEKPEVLLNRLEQQLDSPKYRAHGLGSAQIHRYEGRIRSHNFKMMRIVNGKNSFVPRMKGSLHESGSGTELRASIRFHFIIRFFLFIWILGMIGAGIGIMLQEFKQQAGFLYGLIPISIGIASYLLIVQGFSKAANAAARDLDSMLKAEN